jgi:hypothetical protein
LPGQFYRDIGGNKAGKRRRSWTDGLVWDPREDAFDIAYRKILGRAKEIAISAGEDLVSYSIVSGREPTDNQPNRPL